MDVSSAHTGHLQLWPSRIALILNAAAQQRFLSLLGEDTIQQNPNLSHGTPLFSFRDRPARLNFSLNKPPFIPCAFTALLLNPEDSPLPLFCVFPYS